MNRIIISFLIVVILIGVGGAAVYNYQNSQVDKIVESISVVNDTPVVEDSSLPTPTFSVRKKTIISDNVTAAQVVLSQSDLESLSGNDFAEGILPLGDDQYSLDEPQKGILFFCRQGLEGGGAHAEGPWIGEDTWNSLEKIFVEGEVSWSEATFRAVVNGATRLITGNSLPLAYPTGIFPISSSSEAYLYDRNPNSIKATDIKMSIPTVPQYSEDPYCMPGGEVGVMLSGVPLYNGFDAGDRDAQAHEIQDSCGGHPQQAGQYHYHGLSSCIEDTSVKSVIGYANDGFPITGPVVSEGKYLTSEDLDVCHGVTSEVTDEKGNTFVSYHYVLTYDFPYSVSCFRAEPTDSPRPTLETPEVESSSSTLPTNNNSAGGNPPAEAVAACEDESVGASCTIQTPKDSLSGTCLTPPDSSELACVPN